MAEIPNVGQSSYATPSASRSVASYRTPEVPGTTLGAIGSVLEKQASSQNALDVANAKSVWLRNNIDAENAFNNDQDFTTMSDRYQKVASKNLQESLSLVNDPKERQMLQYQLQTDLAQSNQKIRDLADAKRKDHNHAVIIDSGQKNIDSALRTNDPSIRDQLFSQNITMIDNSDLPELTKAELKQKQAESFGESWLKLHPPGTQVNLLSGAAKIPLGDSIKPIGANADSLTRLAAVESGGNHTAVNPQNPDAVGLYQFSTEKARELGLKDRTDVVESTKAANQGWEQNKVEMAKNLGTQPTDANLYLAWQQGVNGGSSLIKNPDQNAIQTLVQAGVNPEKAKASIVDNLNKEDRASADTMTSADFIKKQEDRWNNAPVDNSGDITIYPKTGTPADFIPIAKKIELHDAAIADQAAEIRAANLLKEQQDKQTQGDFLTKFYNNQLTSDDVMNSSLPAVGTGSKKDFMDMIKDGPKQGNPELHSMLYQSVLRGEINDPSQLVPYLAMPAGRGISVEQAQNLSSVMNKGPDESQKAFLLGAKPQITGSNDLLGIKDPQGDAKYSAMLFELDREIEAGKKKGLTSRDLLDPTSKDYIGKKLLASYVSTVQEKIDATVNAFGSAETTPAKVEPPFGAIQYLRQNPNTATDFEKRFPGSLAKDYLK